MSGFTEYVMSWELVKGELQPVAVLEAEYDESKNALLNGTVTPQKPLPVEVKAKIKTKTKKAKKPRYKKVETRKPRDPELKGKMIAFYEAGGYTEMTEAVN